MALIFPSPSFLCDPKEHAYNLYNIFQAPFTGVPPLGDRGNCVAPRGSTLPLLTSVLLSVHLLSLTLNYLLSGKQKPLPTV